MSVGPQERGPGQFQGAAGGTASSAQRDTCAQWSRGLWAQCRAGSQQTSDLLSLPILHIVPMNFMVLG